jgi:transposase
MEFAAFIGLDVHKDSIAVAIAEEGRHGEVRFYGSIPNTPGALTKLVGKLEAKYGRVEFVYEAGPCGYAVHRHLTRIGQICRVTAPSVIPRKPGDRIKNDHRDAITLARLLRAGELSFVWVPDETHEAVRDLVRARQAASFDVRKARQRIQSFLLKYDRRYSGKSWSGRHRSWLANQQFAHPAQQQTLQHYLNTLDQAVARRDELDGQIREILPSWSLEPIVTALQALRGVALIIAVSTVAELGDMRRFTNPRQLMAYLGLVPGEHSSGSTIRPGGITKAGNPALRALLFEAAWCYRGPAKIGEFMLRRLPDVPQPVKDIAWKAQVRLCGRYRRLVGRGKKSQVAVTAIARELLGFMWAIAHAVKLPAAQEHVG